MNEHDFMHQKQTLIEKNVLCNNYNYSDSNSCISNNNTENYYPQNKNDSDSPYKKSNAHTNSMSSNQFDELHYNRDDYVNYSNDQRGYLRWNERVRLFNESEEYLRGESLWRPLHSYRQCSQNPQQINGKLDRLFQSYNQPTNRSFISVIPHSIDEHTISLKWNGSSVYNIVNSTSPSRQVDTPVKRNEAQEAGYNIINYYSPSVQASADPEDDSQQNSDSYYTPAIYSDPSTLPYYRTSEESGSYNDDLRVTTQPSHRVSSEYQSNYYDIPSRPTTTGFQHQLLPQFQISGDVDRSQPTEYAQFVNEAKNRSISDIYSSYISADATSEKWTPSGRKVIDPRCITLLK
jgi:hypothetical protein